MDRPTPARAGGGGGEVRVDMPLPANVYPIERIENLPVSEVFAAMGSTTIGLTDEEAERRLRVHGPNVIAQLEKPSALIRLAVHFTHLMAWLLWAAGLLAWCVSGRRAGRGR